jgi:hypothetical protein
MQRSQIEIWVRILAARGARALCNFHPLNKQRAQGKPGARCTRGLACNVHQECAHEHTGSAESIRPAKRRNYGRLRGTVIQDSRPLDPERCFDAYTSCKRICSNPTNETPHKPLRSHGIPMT